MHKKTTYFILSFLMSSYAHGALQSARQLLPLAATSQLTAMQLRFLSTERKALGSSELEQAIMKDGPEAVVKKTFYQAAEEAPFADQKYYYDLYKKKLHLPTSPVEVLMVPVCSFAGLIAASMVIPEGLTIASECGCLSSSMLIGIAGGFYGAYKCSRPVEEMRYLRDYLSHTLRAAHTLQHVKKELQSMRSNKNFQQFSPIDYVRLRKLHDYISDALYLDPEAYASFGDPRFEQPSYADPFIKSLESYEIEVRNIAERMLHFDDIPRSFDKGAERKYWKDEEYKTSRWQKSFTSSLKHDWGAKKLLTEYEHEEVVGKRLLEQNEDHFFDTNSACELRSGDRDLVGNKLFKRD